MAMLVISVPTTGHMLVTPMRSRTMVEQLITVVQTPQAIYHLRSVGITIQGNAG